MSDQLSVWSDMMNAMVNDKNYLNVVTQNEITTV